jgi:folate-binding protein YgfZ
MYKLRADVQITQTDLAVAQGTGAAPQGALVDPRHAGLGWRAYGTDAGGIDRTEWDALRVAHCVPEAGVELIPEQSFILEMGFDRLGGVDYRKGCFVGQEVVARMKHKTQLRKGLARVLVDGTAPVGTEILAGEKTAGTLYTQAEGAGLAYLRFDRAVDGMTAGEAVVRLAD